jgi:hypothetical protein
MLTRITWWIDSAGCRHVCIVTSAPRKTAVAHRPADPYRGKRDVFSRAPCRFQCFRRGAFFFLDPATDDTRNAERLTDRALDHLQSGNVFCLAQF